MAHIEIRDFHQVQELDDTKLTEVVGGGNHGAQGAMGIYGEAGYSLAKEREQPKAIVIGKALGIEWNV